ncbi:hypothetical protein DDI74_07065 [Chryseobacterium gleum]|uniref:hypothetical protein n=1 Tax=Chryseobacterium gleum TaxID=250 RepID=UPI00103BE9A3|nr:hypothetical protein [Chryseobacterium gleum]QBJ86026.1 hypothetical protein DDI74_07065 [Chryseobacterium gleum]
MMKKMVIICLFLLFSGKAFSQFYNENMRWSLGFNYSGGSLKNNTENQWMNRYSATLAVDVALSEIAYFNSSELFLQPFAEVSLPVKNPYNANFELNKLGGGVNLKKYLSFNREKSRYYIVAGGQIDYIVWKINYASNGNEKQYREKNIDYLINAGAGVVLTDWMEITAMYSKGLKKVYLSNDIDNRNTFNSFTIGLKIGLSRSLGFDK